ncbi:MAG: hypothetical protein Q8M08_17150 [Bacteroidales bacterium]|nr:hypothetical protein [Bacteroidales bacterium]
MKRVILLSMMLLFAGVTTMFGQPAEAPIKKNQTDLFNDFYISYGTGTLYYFIENEGMEAKNLSGTFLVGFSRSINKLIAVGFQLSYTNIDRTGIDYLYSYQQTVSYTNTKMTDNLWQGIANVRFRYLNTPAFCMYSGVGMGVTMDYYHKTVDSVASNGQKLLPAGQLTLLGFRFGRAISFFGEFGIGTNSILNAGISYKFGD